MPSSRQHDEQYDEALAAARFAAQLNKRKTSDTCASPSLTAGRIEGFGSLSPTEASKKTLRGRVRGRISLTKERLSLTKETMKQRVSGSITAVRARRQTRKKAHGTFQHVPKIIDELAPIRKLRGEDRLRAFFEEYDPDRVESAREVLAYGGRSEVEMWDHLQVQYQVNQRRRLWQALKTCERGSNHCWHCNVDAVLADCQNGDEAEEVIEHHTRKAMAKIEKKNARKDAREMTWDKGSRNSYQQIPPTELND